MPPIVHLAHHIVKNLTHPHLTITITGQVHHVVAVTAVVHRDHQVRIVVPQVEVDQPNIAVPQVEVEVVEVDHMVVVEVVEAVPQALQTDIIN